MERLTIEKAGSILVNDLSGGYTSPCFGCESLGNCVSKKIQPCAIYRALEKLKEYEDLEEQGKLMKLPCKVGDTIWVNGVLGIREAEEYKVIKVDYHSTFGTGRNEFYIEALLENNPENPIGFYDKEIDKTVFLTKSAAEVALQKMKETEVG